MENDPLKEHRSPKKEDTIKNKFNQTIEEIKNNEKVDDLYKYAKTNTSDMIAYIAMIIGLLILFFEPFYGGVIVGFVTGLYFWKEIMIPLNNIEIFIEKLGMVRSLIFGGLLLALLIKVPTIILGAAIAVLIKYLFKSKPSDS